MGVLGQAFAYVTSVLNDPTPGWVNNVNNILNELITRCSTLIDSASIALTTGDLIHGTRTIQVAAAIGQPSGATWVKGAGAAAGYFQGAAATDTVEVALKIHRYQQVTGVRVSGRSTTTAWTARVWLVDNSAGGGGSRTQLGSTLTSGTATSVEQLAIPSFPATQLAAGQAIVVEWTAGAASTRFLGMEVDYKRVVNT